MIATVPVTTALCAAILGFLGATQTINVIANRVRTRVDAGDGGVAALAQAIRAHANFVEQAPLALIVIALAEALGACLLVVQALGAALVAARLPSAYALNRSLAQSPLRQFGGGLSVLIITAASSLAPLGGRGIRLERDDFPLSKTGIHVSGSCSGDRQEHARRRQLLFAAIVAESGITPNSKRRALFPPIPSTLVAGRPAS